MVCAFGQGSEIGGWGYVIVRDFSAGRTAISLLANALLQRLSQITCAVVTARRDALTLERPLDTRDVHGLANRYIYSTAFTRAASRLIVSWAMRLSRF